MCPPVLRDLNRASTEGRPTFLSVLSNERFRSPLVKILAAKAPRRKGAKEEIREVSSY